MTKHNATQFELFPSATKRRSAPESQREMIFKLIYTSQEVTTNEIMDIFSLPESIVTLRLRELVKEGRIRALAGPQSDDQGKRATLWVLGNQKDYRPF